MGRPLERARWLFQGKLDPNDWRLVKDDAVGLRYMPLTTHGHARTGTRERVLETARRHPDRLRIELNALATRVIFDGQQRAVGVEYLSGERLYRADPRASRAEGQRREVRASREVILAGGAFNTPQLLMLSGIGPRDTLARHGIGVRVDLPGVGQNLQDRYETSVIHRMSFDRWDCLKGARFLRRRSPPRPVDDGPPGRLRDQRRHVRHDHALRARPSAPRPVHPGPARALPGVLPGLLGGDPRES